MTRWLGICLFVGCAATAACGGDDGPSGPTGPVFGEACGEAGECDTGLVCNSATICVGSNTLTVTLDFSAPSQRRFDDINLGLLSLDDRELIAEAQKFDPSLVQLFSAQSAPSDWPAEIQLEGVPAGDQWIVITMPDDANTTDYADQRFQYRSDGTLLDLNGDPASSIEALFYTNLPVGTL